MFSVKIEGRDVKLASRLLDALTRSGCLTPKITWKETIDEITLQVNGADDDIRVFQSFRFQVIKE